MDNYSIERPAVSIIGLSKLYKNGRGVENISLSLKRGESLGLLGPNGSGKTTIMKVVVGLCHADKGIVELFGHSIEREYEKAAKSLGSLIEAPALYGFMTARENLMLAARYYDGNPKERVEHVLELVHLEKYAKDKASRFSLGMKQRLGIALALIGEPELLVLDEPVNGLDIEGIVDMREILIELREKTGVAMLVSSHIAGELEKLCGRVAVLHEGKLLADENIHTVLAQNPTLEDFYLEKVRRHRVG